MAELFRPLTRGLFKPLFEPGLGSGSGGGLPAGFADASLYHNYALQQYLRAPAPSITRASTKTVLSSAGLLSTVASGALALSDRGLSIEESRQNVIRNNTMQGAVAGSPGALPTNWSTSLIGLTQTVVGVGTQNGIDYIDLRFSGTSSGTTVEIRFEGLGTVAASNGQTWSQSVFAGIVAGSLTNITVVRNALNQFDGSNVFLSQLNAAIVLDGSFREFSNPLTTNNASTAFVRPMVTLITSGVGVAIDVTIRIGWPQLELGAFATSYIPTTSAAVTRAADVITIPSPTSYVSLAQGGAFVEWTEELGPVGTTRILWAMRVDGSNYMRAEVLGTDNRVYFRLVTAGVQEGLVGSTSAVVAGQTYKMAIRWAANDIAAAMSPSLLPVVGTDTSAAMPTGSPVLGVGQNAASGGFLNSPLRRLALWQTGPSNAELQALVS